MKLHQFEMTTTPEKKVQFGSGIAVLSEVSIEDLKRILVFVETQGTMSTTPPVAVHNTVSVNNAQPVASAVKPAAPHNPTPSKPASQAAPVGKKPESKKEEKPAEEEQGDTAYFRLPTVRAIVEAILKTGITSSEAVTKKCEDLQALGVTALDVVPVEDLPARVKAAFAQLGK